MSKSRMYSVEDGYVIATDRYLYVDKTINVERLQVYMKDGEILYDIFEDDIVDYDSPRVFDETYEYHFRHREINVDEIEYIEINGEKYYSN